MFSYRHNLIEKKWQKKWEENKIFESKEYHSAKGKYYCLVMLPYPSGNLHMGHVRNYTIGDIFARFYRMKGRNVLHPMGWDAFGLPAENAAIKNKIHPAKWTKQNITHMKNQLKALGISYDWNREISTCNPEYYKWNQWFFIKMWEKDLVFRKNSNVNWCPSCKTVLANEQVLDGICWRCKSITDHKKLEQWFIKTTNYADELLEGIKQLATKWPEQVLSMQKNWIGKSSGLEIDFKLTWANKKLKIFTTRPDTIFGVTFMVISPEHKIVDEIKSKITNYGEVFKYIIESKKKSAVEKSGSREKTGIKIEGVNAINPINEKEIPIFVADYVLTNYSSGAIMAVPAHDQRDWEFAKKKRIPIIEVIRSSNHYFIDKQPYEGEGVLVNSGQFNGIHSNEALKVVSNWIEKQKFGKKKINFKLKDWLISRQRYWGTPIPMIHCKNCGIVPVEQNNLPIMLPKNIGFFKDGESSLKTDKTFINVRCPKCATGATRDTDTMDTFVDSSWYYLRYCDVNNSDVVFDSAKVNYWMPVDQYIGGIEHACMHLIYSRFWYKVARDMGIVKSDEPFLNLLTQGMVTLNGSAMSKSRGNTVSPDEIIQKYGADTLRLFILFAAPIKKRLDWSLEGIVGCRRFINRIWRLFNIVHVKSIVPATDKTKIDILKMMHYTVKKVTNDIEKEFQFNTAISSIMELVNFLYVYNHHLNDDGISISVYKTVILLLSPFTPHVCDEIWEMFGNKKSIFTCSWPSYDENLLKKSSIEIPVQINGKLKGKVTVSLSDTENEIKEKLIKIDKIAEELKNKQIIKFIYIKNKIVALVAK
jgi:leucyl-tRNA synthetase